MKNLGVFWSVSVLMILSASNLFAQAPGQSPMGGGPRSGMEKGRMERPSPHAGARRGTFFSLQGLKEALSLTDDQAKELHNLFIDYRKGVILKQANLQVAEIELEEVVAEPKLDLAKVEKKAKDKEAASTDLLMYRVRSLAKAKEFLSDAQFEKFRRLIEHRMMAGVMTERMQRKPHGRSGMWMERMSPHPSRGKEGMSEAESYSEAD